MDISELKKLIGDAKSDFEATEPTEQDVELGGKLVKLAFLPVWGGDWSDLTAANPPRPGATLDGNLGYNVDGVAADYPADRVTVDGAPVDQDTWRELVGVLSSPNRKNVAAVLYGLNHLEPIKKIAAAGKASRGSQPK